jgi:hypothetical protein
VSLRQRQKIQKLLQGMKTAFPVQGVHRLKKEARPKAATYDNIE